MTMKLAELPSVERKPDTAHVTAIPRQTRWQRLKSDVAILFDARANLPLVVRPGSPLYPKTATEYQALYHPYEFGRF